MIDMIMLLMLAAGFTYRTLLLMNLLDSTVALIIVFVIGLLIGFITMLILRFAIHCIVRQGILHTKSLFSLFIGFIPILYILLTQHWSDLIFFLIFPAMLVLALLARDRWVKLLREGSE